MTILIVGLNKGSLSNANGESKKAMAEFLKEAKKWLPGNIELEAYQSSSSRRRRRRRRRYHSNLPLWGENFWSLTG
ncbi:hypothetical protein [Echinicola sp. 20G]|uniref:hypothetical protein n=1 Tax=Echinicola sp. 20G TaxID=2781961 RepID=UPI001910E40A|nr:hypothetical protein [Echinicola sp. 20G]